MATASAMDRQDAKQQGNKEMKTTKNTRAVMDCTRRLARYQGITKDANGKEREYDLVSTRCRVYRDPSGAVVEPFTEGAQAEYYGVSFTPNVWDAIADTASVLDTVILEGTLVIPEAGETGHFEGTRADGTKYESGDLREALPIDFKPGKFKGGKLPKTADLIPVTGEPKAE